eukprot:3003957-Pleurochrysis_carterae.AAC.1
MKGAVTAREQREHKAGISSRARVYLQVGAARTRRLQQIERRVPWNVHRARVDHVEREPTALRRL